MAELGDGNVAQDNAGRSIPKPPPLMRSNSTPQHLLSQSNGALPSQSYGALPSQSYGAIPSRRRSFDVRPNHNRAGTSRGTRFDDDSLSDTEFFNRRFYSSISDSSFSFLSGESFELPKDDGKNQQTEDRAEPLSRAFVTRVWISLLAMLMCYITAFISLVPLGTQYFSERVGLKDYNVTYDETVGAKCLGNSTNVPEETADEIEKDVSSFMLNLSISSGIPSIFICFFVGSYADFIGRKPLLIVSLFGGLVRFVIFAVVIQHDLDINITLLGALVDGLCGSMFTISLASVAMITDITPDPKERAIRFAVVEGVLLIAGGTSQVVMGALIKEVGYFTPAVTCASLVGVAFLLAMCIPETKLANKAKFTWNPTAHARKVLGFYFFDGTRLKRTQYLLGILFFIGVQLSFSGRNSVNSLYQMNTPFCMDALERGIFAAIKQTITSVAAILLLRLLKGKVSLEFTGVVCIVSMCADFILTGFAESDDALYLAALAGLLSHGVIPIPRALLSQIASPTEQGALFSGMSVVQSVSTMASVATYNLVYNVTMNHFRGSVFMLMAGACIVTAAILLAFRRVREHAEDRRKAVVFPASRDIGPTHHGAGQVEDVSVLAEDEIAPLLTSMSSAALEE
ncbi:proton-coupled folate transporter [Aplysia californica]|uniref:Proton-coupled folate transporter n=1 Tax=Aplysia californica TaxID=6500 RepID=A0ABM1A8J3_APLCA|nr:proton-coupled folate transporter [Aplysia californica]